MRTLILASVAAVAAASLCGCVDSVDGPLSPTFGKAVATMDTQIIPTQVSDQAPASSGEVAAAAVGRYQKGQVYKPEAASTSTVGGYGGAK
jgi:hypothetical protein